MTPAESNAAARERRRDEILAACLEDPQLAAEVCEFFADRARLDRLARPPRPGPDEPPPGPGEATQLHPQPGEGAAGVPAAAPVGSFGDYELLAEIARGGMGVVYRARHLKLNRLIALKMILT